MNGRLQRFENALAGVVRDVVDQLRPRGQRAGHLQVQRHLQIELARRPDHRVRVRTVHTDVADPRQRQPEPGEVRLKIRPPVATAQRDDRQDLPGAVGAGREPVQPAELDGRVDDLRLAVQRPELRPGAGLRVQPQHRQHRAVQLGRHLQLPVVPPVPHGRLAERVVALEKRDGGAENLGQRAQRAGHHNQPGRQVGTRHPQPQPPENPLYQRQIGRIGAVPLAQLSPGDHTRPLDQTGRQLRLPPEQQAEFGPGDRRRHGIQRPLVQPAETLTTRQRDLLLNAHGGLPSRIPQMAIIGHPGWWWG